MSISIPNKVQHVSRSIGPYQPDPGRTRAGGLTTNLLKSGHFAEALKAVQRRRFLPSGRQSVTLRESLTTSQSYQRPNSAHWQLAVETLINSAEGRDFLMHARIADFRALNHSKLTLVKPPGKKAKAYRIVR